MYSAGVIPVMFLKWRKKDERDENPHIFDIFISLRTVLPFAVDLLKPTGSIAALIKPQFEVGKSGLGKKGIVKDPKLREKVVNEIKECVSFMGLKIAGTVRSPIAGGDGNIEYLIYLLR